ncbi:MULTISPECIES: hypothetical protein [Cysteiniphilum]|uniref:hypothetical protein n=1 Tax=Cysteiniphilum TaxID=2056696 RepID=UPI00177E22F1|nr:MULTISPECIES: hypothetical protein [Cysteiniphilum]
MKFNAYQDEVVRILKGDEVSKRFTGDDGFNMVPAIKYFRDKTNCGLKEGKDYCDKLVEKIKKGEL